MSLILPQLLISFSKKKNIAFNIIFKKKTHQLGINTNLPKALLAIVKSGQMKNNSTINSLPRSHSVQLTDLVSFA